MELLAVTSLIFGSFSGWLSGDNRGTLLGRMIAFSAFVAISGLYIASVTAGEESASRYFTALWAYGVAYVCVYYLFAKISEKRARKASLISWRGDNVQMNLSDFVATLAALTHLSEEQLKATSSVVASINSQLEIFKKASEEKSASVQARKRALEVEPD